MITYTKEQRAIAARENKALVTIAIPGFEFQGPVDAVDLKPLDDFVMQWIVSRYKEPEQVTATRTPYARSTIPDENPQNLPLHKTCGDCDHFEYCKRNIGRIAGDEFCDWHPSRFAQKGGA